MKQLLVCLVVFLCVRWFPVLSQDAVSDSLKRELTSATGAKRVELLCDMAQQYSRTNPALGLEYARKAVDDARKLEDPLLLANALNGLAIAFFYLGNHQESLQYLLQSIDQLKVVLEQDTSNQELLYRIAVFSNNAGNVY
jgi:tetratricopeptide (TPR) repeat protein